MGGRTIADVVLAHIGHAERWLRRARADYERGDLRQVVLRLLLAEAEIRRARESGAAIADLPPRRPAHLPWAIAAAAAAGLILAGYALIRPYAAGPVAQVPDQMQLGHGRGSLTGIVRFGDTGQVLPFVGLPFVAFPGRAGVTGTPLGIAGVDMDRLITIGDDGPVSVTFR